MAFGTAPDIAAPIRATRRSHQCLNSPAKPALNRHFLRLFQCLRPCLFIPDPVSLHLLRAPPDSQSLSMRLSRFFLPILKENPKEAEIVSHRLKLRAGMMRQEAAGTYALPAVGFRAVKQTGENVRDEQNRARAVEL